MRLPQIVDNHAASDEAAYTLFIPHDCDAFDGHFPGRPILPGVAQIDWVAQLAARTWKLPPVARMFQVKFRNIISPGNTVTLTLNFDRSRGRVYFKYSRGDLVMSSGRIVVEPLLPERGA